MKNNYSSFVVVSVLAMAFASIAQAQTTDATTIATFEDTASELNLQAESHYSGLDLGESVTTSTFTSGPFVFNMYGYQAWSTWDLFAISNETATTYDSYSDQFRNVTGSGANGSATYAVVYCSGYNGTPTILTTTEGGQTLSGFYITNTAYAYSSMTNGDYYAKKHEQGDWYKVTITADNGKAVDYYLSDFRSDDAADHYILDAWDWVDLSSLGQVEQLTFAVSGSDVGTYGLNTPAYFAMDDFNGTAPADVLHATATAIDAVTTSATDDDVTITGYYDLNGRRLSQPQHGVTIVRYSNGVSRKVVF